MPRRYSRNDVRYNDKTEKLERLIRRYEKAIVAKDQAAIDYLIMEVEKEADRIGYENHGRLAHLHTLAEKSGDEA